MFEAFGYKQVNIDNNSYEVRIMFSNTKKKKLRNRVIAAALGVFVMTFGIWLNYSKGSETAPAEKAVKKVKIDEEKSEKNNEKDEKST